MLVVPTTLADQQALLDNIGQINESRSPSQGQSSTDEFFLSNKQYDVIETVKPGSRNIYIWKQQPVRGSSNDWAAAYTPIYIANLVIENLGNITENLQNKGDRDQIKGQALFVRAYYYLTLLWNYSKAYDAATADKDWGIALRMSSNFNVLSKRSMNLECYSQVINDVKIAIPLLPPHSHTVTRASRTAGYGLLARCYLSMRDYPNALLYADSCLQLKSDLMNYNSSDSYKRSINDRAPFVRFNKEILFYSCMNSFNLLHYTASFSRVDTSLYRSYDSKDLRQKAFFFISADKYPSFKGTYNSDSYNIFFTGITTAEVSLMKAECLVRAGFVPEGLNELGKLLVNRYVNGDYKSPVGLPQEEALKLVLSERRKELIMRGIRWMDIKRLNKENRNIILERVINGQSYSLKPNDPFYALPLPDDIVEITGMPQND